jgi:hypothetical protein
MKELKPHPFTEHVNSLPSIPGMTLFSVHNFTPEVAKGIFRGYELPKRGDALIVNILSSVLPLCRVTRLPIVKGNTCRYVAEYFRKGSE